MAFAMPPLLVIGASGLVGRRLVQALLAQGQTVRCLARDPARVTDLAAAGCDVELGDILDPAAVGRAVEGTEGIYIAIHTLSRQPAAGDGDRFMDIEDRGVDHVIAAARATGVRRIVYVTSLGTTSEARSEWLRERWRVEERLLHSGLDATVIRPGHIAGVGGHGFDAVLAGARRRIAVTMVGDRPLFRTIALDDLVQDLIGVLAQPGALGQRLDVGSEDVLSVNQMIDIAADVLDRASPVKVQIPRALLEALAPIVGTMAGLPRGAFAGFVQSMAVDDIGDPTPIGRMLPRRRLSFRESVERAIGAQGPARFSSHNPAPKAVD
jgi:uncharacterized protein YbjT (DUF2867 family)